jgi:hypothetical protein
MEMGVNNCINQHEKDFQEMAAQRDSKSINQKHMGECFFQWFHTDTQVVDSVMWRYCYYHQRQDEQ